MKNEALKFLKKICKNRVKVTKKMVIFFLMTGGLLLSQVNFSESVDETKTVTIKDLKNYDYPNSLHFVSVQYSDEDVKEYKDYYKYLDLLKEKIGYLKEIEIEKLNGNDKNKIREIKDKKIKKLKTTMDGLKEGNELISQKVTNEIEKNLKKPNGSDKDKKIEEINKEYTERIDKINKLGTNFNNLGIDLVHSIAIGKGAEISGENGIAIGVDTLSGKDSISLGKASIASGEGNIAIGRDATLFSKTFKGKVGQQIARILNNPNTIVKFENEGDVEYKKTIVIGDGTKSSGNSNIAIGDNAVAMKKRLTLISLQDGGTLSNKNGAEIEARNWNDIAKQFYKPDDDDKRNYTFEAKPVENAIALGKNASAFADNVIAIGKGAISGFESAVSIGENADTEGKNSVAIGKNSKIFGESSVAIGEGSRTGKIKYVLKTIDGKDKEEKTEEFDTLEAAKQELKKKNDLSKIYRIEIGGEKSENSVAIGKNSAVEYKGSVAIGEDSLAVKSDGKSAFTDVDHTSGETVSFGKKDRKRRLTNVADGKDSSDAVTVAQLQKAIADNKGGSGGSAVDSKLKLSDGKETKDLSLKDDTLEIANGTNTTVTLTKDDAKKKATFKVDVNSNLTGITSITNGNEDSANENSKIKLEDNKLTLTNNGKSVKISTKETNGDKETLIEFDRPVKNKKSGGKLDPNPPKEDYGIGTINYLKDRRASKDTDYGTGTNIGRAATEGAVKEVYDKINESKVSVEQGEGIKVTSTDNKYTVALADGLKTKIDGALQSSVADSKYTNISLSNIDETAKNTIKDKAKESIEIVEDKKESSKNDSGIVITKSEDKNSHKDTYKIKLDESKVKEIAGTTNLATEYAKVDADNITVNKWAEKLGTGTVATDDKGLVTGGTVFNAIKNSKTKVEKEGDIITLTTTPSTDDGISSVTYKLGIDDTKLKAKINESKVSVEQGEGIKVTSTDNKYTVALADGLKTKIDGALQSSVADSKYTNISLSNIDETAKNTIKDKAKESIEIVEDKKESSKNDSGIVITKSEDKNSHKDTYKIKLDESKVKEIAGTTNLATEYAKVDADNITVNKWAEKLGTGTVATDDKGLVTGGTVFNAIKNSKTKVEKEGDIITLTTTPSTDDGISSVTYKLGIDDTKLKAKINESKVSVEQGEGIKVTSTDNKYTVALADGLKTKIDGALQSSVADSKYTNISLSNIDETAKNTIKDKAKESIEIVEDKKESSKNDSGIVITKSEDKNSHKDTYKIKLDESKVKEIAGTTNLATEYAKVDADNITVNKWAEKLGTGTVATDDKGLVTGGTVFNAIKNSKTKVEKEGDIITLTTTPSTDDGISSVTYKLGIDDTKLKAKINESKVSVEQGEGIKVTSTGNEYKVALAEGLKTKIEGALQSSVADGKYAKLDASNITEANWVTKLGDADIENGTKLAKSSAVKDYVNNEINNITTTVSGKLSSADVNVKGDDYISVASDTTKPNHYTLTFDKDKLGKELDLTNNTNLNTKFNKYALLDGSNLGNTEFNLTTWQSKLGTGKVVNGDAGLVTGSTIYNYMTTFKQQLSSESTKDLAKKLNANADNLSEAGKTSLTNKLGTGEVAEGDTKLVTGGKVYTKLNEIKTDLDNKYTALNQQVTTNTGDITALKTDVEDLKKTKQDITDINTKLDGKLDKADLSIKGDGYITAKKDEDDKFNYTLAVNKTKLESDLDLTNNTSVNNIVDTKLGGINTNLGDLTNKVGNNTSSINSLTTKADTNTKDITNLKQDMTKKLDADATNLSETGKTNLIDKLSKDSNIAKPKDRLVTDKQVNKYLSRYNDALGVVDKKSTVALEKSELALGGVANAVAMANLVQVNSYSRHRHNLSAAYGYYGGSHALAVGFSGTNEERNFVYKLSGSVNNKGNLAFGVGAGVMLGDKDERLTTEYSTKLKSVEKDLVEANKKIKEYEERQKATDIKVKELERKLNQILNKH
ncbi:YadA-like family protein [Sneathia sanguinegens]|uniref:YadA-like family protein n=1 Tax=Sneathia sanguinegens TaxID=40543 RepID=UPI0023F6253A|nr:YadA-like family protein [Sneathia sanguinegens]